jgi:hypothetical protein
MDGPEREEPVGEESRPVPPDGATMGPLVGGCLCGKHTKPGEENR